MSFKLVLAKLLKHLCSISNKYMYTQICHIVIYSIHSISVAVEMYNGKLQKPQISQLSSKAHC